MDTDLNATAAAEIRAEMARQRRRDADLAAHLGVSPKTVSATLNGRRRIDLNDIERISEFLGVDLIEALASSRNLAA